MSRQVTLKCEVTAIILFKVLFDRAHQMLSKTGLFFEIGRMVVVLCSVLYYIFYNIFG